MIGSRRNLDIDGVASKYPAFHHKSYYTIEAIEEESNRAGRKTDTFVEVEVDAEEERLLPPKEKKNVGARTRMVSGKLNINSYLHNMGKTSFDFYNGISDKNNRYREYKEQETIFSKTISVRPVAPLQETLNTFAESAVRPNPTLPKEEEKTTRSSFPDTKEKPSKNLPNNP